MSPLTTIALPIALGIIMFGLGLSLRPADFARVAKHPKAVIIALVCQLLLLPAICLGLVVLFRLPPILAVGMRTSREAPSGPAAARTRVAGSSGGASVTGITNAYPSFLTVRMYLCARSSPIAIRSACTCFATLLGLAPVCHSAFISALARTGRGRA